MRGTFFLLSILWQRPAVISDHQSAARPLARLRLGVDAEWRILLPRQWIIDQRSALADSKIRRKTMLVPGPWCSRPTINS